MKVSNLRTSHFIVKVVYRGLLGSQGFYVQGRTLQPDGTIMRVYVSLNDIVWC